MRSTIRASSWRTPVLVLGAAFVVVAACAQNENADIPPPTGGNKGGTSSSGGTGGSATGGSTTGGSATGGGFTTGGASGSGGSLTGGSAGTTTGGTSGAGGGTSGGTAGSGGTSGGGTGGTAGTSTADAGAGGEGPIIGAGGASSCADDFTVRVKAESGNAAEFQYSFEITNVNAGSIMADDIELRFFFSNEEDSAWSFDVYDADRNQNGGTAGPSGASDLATSVVLSSKQTMTPSAGQDTYFKYTFNSTVAYVNGDYLFFKGRGAPANYSAPNVDKTNDFSQLGSTSWHATTTVGVYVSGVLRGGCEP